MQPRHRILAFAVGLIASSTAVACGIYFPWQLLQDRANTFHSLPLNSFLVEAARLVPKPQETFKIVEPDQTGYSFSGYPSNQSQPTHALSAGSDTSFAAGQLPPPDERLYGAGAADYAAGNYPAAIIQFQSVLLASPKPGPKTVPAAFMLGQSFGKSGDIDKAAAAFALTRDLVRKGAADPLGLALASYGAEARFHLLQAEALNGASLAALSEEEATGDNASPPTGANDSLTPATALIFQHEVGRAVQLYAQQAADGSTEGVNSLAIVALRLSNDPTALNASIRDPTVARLLVSFVLARDDSVTILMNRPDFTTGTPGPLQAVVDAFGSQNMVGFPGADRLAAAAYRIGSYDMADKLTAGLQTPLAYWIRAKLAVRNGDMSGAAADYARSAAAFPTVNPEDRLDPEAQARIVGEAGTLALSRGELVQSLVILYPVAVNYWADVVHIAERVLTTDELKDFIDHQAPVISLKLSDGLPTDSYWGPKSPADGLRYILAKRLVRDGRFAEALPYFDDAGLRQHVADYANDLHDAKSDWWPVARARASFEAAVLARQYGMEMMGYTAQPDDSYTGGEGYGFGEATTFGPFASKLELARYAASMPQPNLRFHYRYIAVDEATRAADLLPARSQAFAAVLCRASGWMIDRDPDLGVHLYERYLKEGAAVPWADQFARHCPTPDFAGATHLMFTMPLMNLHDYLSRHRLVAFGIGGTTLFVLGIVCGTGFMRLRLRRNATSATL